MAQRLAWWLPVCLLSGLVATARASPPHEGRLVTKHGAETIDVPLEHTDVRIRVDGFLVDATVTQKFRNPYPEKIEAVYVFPLPVNAAVDEMQIASGGRVTRGAIMKRDEAVRVYEQARASGKLAALLAQERPNMFVQNVANLEPGATVDVTLRYVQRLDYDNGGYELVFPMVAGPRYVPQGTKSDLVQPAALPPGLRSSHDISLRVDIDAGVPIEGVASSSHLIGVTRSSDRVASVHILPSDTIPNKDFTLRYRVAGTAPQFGVLAHRDGAQGSFLLVAQPPANAAPEQIAPRELVFVLDTSSSMRGAPLEKAKQVIRAALAQLRPDDTFQIVRFDDQASALGAGPIANKPRNVELVLDWLAKLDAAGGTEMTRGIAAALAVPHDPARLRIVTLLTDGYIGNEDAIIKQVAERAGDARIFAFGVGSAVNRYLLDEMTYAGRGSVQYVRPDDDTQAAVAAFERRIDAPTLTDVRVDWGGLAIGDVSPRAIPDLFVGQPLALAGHYAKGGAGVVTIRGKRAGRDVVFTVPVTLPDREPERAAIGTVWARQRISELSRKLVRADDKAAVSEIVALSLEHHLLTQYTAFVAVDDTRATSGGAGKRVVVPVEIPDGLDGGGYAGQYATIGYGGGSGSIASGWGVGHGGYGMRSHVAPLPVTIGSPTVTGSLDRSIIKRYIKRHLAQITYCYEKELLAKPTLDGTIALQFLIGPTGNVLVANATGFDKQVASCIEGVVKAIEFPAAGDGGNIQVNYPFTFHKAGESAPAKQEPLHVIP